MEHRSLTPDEVALVLHRAAELQAVGDTADGEGLLDADDVTILGRELGLRDDVVQAAMAERQAPALPDPAPPLLGLRASVAVERDVRLTSEQAQSAVGRWLEQQWFDAHRRRPGHVRWQARTGVAADLRRSLDLRGTLRLKGVCTVDVRTTPTRADDATRLRIDVAVTGTRAELVGGLVVAPAGVVAAGAVLAAVLASPVALVALPGAAALGGAGWLGARTALSRRGRVLCDDVDAFLDGLPQA